MWCFSETLHSKLLLCSTCAATPAEGSLKPVPLRSVKTTFCPQLFEHYITEHLQPAPCQPHRKTKSYKWPEATSTKEQRSQKGLRVRSKPVTSTKAVGMVLLRHSRAVSIKHSCGGRRSGLVRRRSGALGVFLCTACLHCPTGREQWQPGEKMLR